MHVRLPVLVRSLSAHIKGAALPAALWQDQGWTRPLCNTPLPSYLEVSAGPRPREHCVEMTRSMPLARAERQPWITGVDTSRLGRELRSGLQVSVITLTCLWLYLL